MIQQYKYLLLLALLSFNDANAGNGNDLIYANSFEEFLFTRPAGIYLLGFYD